MIQRFDQTCRRSPGTGWTKSRRRCRHSLNSWEEKSGGNVDVDELHVPVVAISGAGKIPAILGLDLQHRRRGIQPYPSGRCDNQSVAERRDTARGSEQDANAEGGKAPKGRNLPRRPAKAANAAKGNPAPLSDPERKLHSTHITSQAPPRRHCRSTASATLGTEARHRYGESQDGLPGTNFTLNAVLGLAKRGSMR